MTKLKTLFRACVVALALLGMSAAAPQQAKADGGAVVAGIAGGLILGTIIGSNANRGYYGGYYSNRPVIHSYRPYPRYRAYSYSRPYYGGGYRHRPYRGYNRGYRRGGYGYHGPRYGARHW